jgi:glycosyltransferase involved in cell wall biosynthesis
VRVLVYPHDLDMGGCQLNAIDLAAHTRDLGHDVVVFGRPGVLLERLAELDLEFVEAPDPAVRPSPSVVRALAALVHERGIDVLHGYEWPPGLECLLAARRSGAVAVTTVLSMAVAPFLPRTMPLIVGTQQIADTEREVGRQRVHVVEPPVDVRLDQPGVVAPLDIGPAADDRPAIVIVCRLVRELKLEGIIAAVRAMPLVNASVPARLVIVGDGEARAEVEEHATRVNQAVGPGTVVLAGEILDPRPAYELADVSIGMGSSAVRALAFATPLVVQGEEGYFRLLTPETLPEFLWQGWYGRGGAGASSAHLAGLIVALLGSPSTRQELGAFGRRLAEQRFSLESAARRQVDIYAGVLARPPGGELVDDVASAGRWARYKVTRKVDRWRGRAGTDDFNARPVAGSPGQSPTVTPIARSSSSARADQL